jgi:chromate reductase
MSESTLQFATMLGSLRHASYTRAIAETLDELAPDDVAVTLLGSVGGLPHFNQDLQDLGIPDEVVEMGAAVASADAVVIVTPEYNYSTPGVLKNALDWLSRLPRRPFEGKPVAIQSASPGLLGESRAQYHLRQILVALDAVVLNKPEIIVPQVASKVDIATATLRDEFTRTLVAAQLAALRDLARQHWRQAA